MVKSLILYWSTLLEAYVLCSFIYTGEKKNERASHYQLVLYNKRIRLVNNDFHSCIEMNSKEVIVKSCQIFKARFVNGRIKQNGNRSGRRQLKVNVFEYLRIYEKIFGQKFYICNVRK